jgi:probable rRNA maturation factor
MNDAVKVAVQIATGDDEIPPGAEWAAWVQAAVAAAEIDARMAGCVTLRLVGRDESQHLNEMYRQKSGPTNVLAFPGHAPGGNEALVSELDRELGDLVVCLPVVHDEAGQQEKSVLAHLAHMIVHGTLHLAGFDHEDPAAATRMEALETHVMIGLGFQAPYESDAVATGEV